jgi:hypothetical protein
MDKRRKSKKSKRSTFLYIGAGILLTFTLLGIWIYWGDTVPVLATESLDTFLQKRHHVMVRPFRNDLMPMAIVTKGLNGRLDLMVDAPSDAILQKELVQETVSFAIEKDGHGGIRLGGADVKAAGEAEEDSVLEFEIKNLRTFSASTRRIREQFEKDARIAQTMREATLDDLYGPMVVIEATVVDQIVISQKRSLASSVETGIDQSKLAATISMDVNRSDAGTYVAKGPAVIGVKLARLSTIKNSLGSGDEELSINPISPTEFEKMPVRLPGPDHSQFQILGLIVAQGNYRQGNRWYQGRLEGVHENAKIVENSLLPLTGKDGGLATLVTAKTGSGIIRRDHFITKQQIENAIYDLQSTAAENFDPNRPSLIVFYYFGHGLSEKAHGDVWLIPEAYRPPKIPDDATPTDALSEIIDRTVSLGWVIEQLSKVSDRVLILADACRDGDPDAREINLNDIDFLPTEISNLYQDVQKIFRFMTGLDGPHPVLLGGRPGEKVWTVDYQGVKVGPVALRLYTFWDQWGIHPKSLTLREFIEEIERPAGKMKVRAYTELKPRFRDTMPTWLLACPKRCDPVHRLKPFKIDWKPQPTPQPSGVRVQVLARVDDLDDIAVDQKKGAVFLCRASGISTINALGAVSDPKYGDPDFGFMGSIAFDSNGSLLLASESDNRLERISGEVRTTVAEEKFVTRLRLNPHTNRVIAVSDDATVGTPDPVYLVGDSLVQITNEFDLTSAEDVIEIEPGSLMWCDDAGKIWHGQVGQKARLFAELEEPTALAVGEHHLLVLAMGGKRLYRFVIPGSDQLSPAFVDLVDVGFANEHTRSPTAAGGMYFGGQNSVLLVVSGKLLRLDLHDAKWQRYQ